jgi:hypothetical protein
MAGISELKALAARKRALVEESELHRQTLRLELQNVRLYGARIQSRFQRFKAARPLLLALPLFGAFWRWGRRSAPKPKLRGWRRWFNLGLSGWRAYRRFAPVLGAMSVMRSRSMRNRNGAHLPTDA